MSKTRTRYGYEFRWLKIDGSPGRHVAMPAGAEKSNTLSPYGITCSTPERRISLYISKGNQHYCLLLE